MPKEALMRILALAIVGSIRRREGNKNGPSVWLERAGAIQSIHNSNSQIEVVGTIWRAYRSGKRWQRLHNSEQLSIRGNTDGFN